MPFASVGEARDFLRRSLTEEQCSRVRCTCACIFALTPEISPSATAAAAEAVARSTNLAPSRTQPAPPAAKLKPAHGFVMLSDTGVYVLGNPPRSVQGVCEWYNVVGIRRENDTPPFIKKGKTPKGWKRSLPNNPGGKIGALTQTTDHIVLTFYNGGPEPTLGTAKVDGDAVAAVAEDAPSPPLNPRMSMHVSDSKFSATMGTDELLEDIDEDGSNIGGCDDSAIVGLNDDVKPAPRISPPMRKTSLFGLGSLLASSASAKPPPSQTPERKIRELHLYVKDDVASFLYLVLQSWNTALIIHAEQAGGLLIRQPPQPEQSRTSIAGLFRQIIREMMESKELQPFSRLAMAQELVEACCCSPFRMTIKEEFWSNHRYFEFLMAQFNASNESEDKAKSDEQKILYLEYSLTLLTLFRELFRESEAFAARTEVLMDGSSLRELVAALCGRPSSKLIREIASSDAKSEMKALQAEYDDLSVEIFYELLCLGDQAATLGGATLREGSTYILKEASKNSKFAKDFAPRLARKVIRVFKDPDKLEGVDVGDFHVNFHLTSVILQRLLQQRGTICGHLKSLFQHEFNYYLRREMRDKVVAYIDELPLGRVTRLILDSLLENLEAFK